MHRARLEPQGFAGRDDELRKHPHARNAALDDRRVHLDARVLRAGHRGYRLRH